MGSLVLAGDSGEKRLIRSDIHDLDILDLELLQIRIYQYQQDNPRLKIEWREDITTGDQIIRWRTLP